MRIAIAGHPRSGKSTLAFELGVHPIRLTDDAIPIFKKWNRVVTAVSTWFDQPGPWTICGVVVPHALREWQRFHRGRPPPIDHFIFIRRPTLDGLTKSQTIMAQGIDTVTGDLRQWLYPVFTTEHNLRELLKWQTHG